MFARGGDVFHAWNACSRPFRARLTEWRTALHVLMAEHGKFRCAQVYWPAVLHFLPLDDWLCAAAGVLETQHFKMGANCLG